MALRRTLYVAILLVIILIWDYTSRKDIENNLLANINPGQIEENEQENSAGNRENIISENDVESVTASTYLDSPLMLDFNIQTPIPVPVSIKNITNITFTLYEFNLREFLSEKERPFQVEYWDCGSLPVVNEWMINDIVLSQNNQDLPENFNFPIRFSTIRNGTFLLDISGSNENETLHSRTIINVSSIKVYASLIDNQKTIWVLNSLNGTPAGVADISIRVRDNEGNYIWQKYQTNYQGTVRINQEIEFQPHDVIHVIAEKNDSISFSFDCAKSSFPFSQWIECSDNDNMENCIMLDYSEYINNTQYNSENLPVNLHRNLIRVNQNPQISINEMYNPTLCQQDKSINIYNITNRVYNFSSHEVNSKPNTDEIGISLFNGQLNFNSSINNFIIQKSGIYLLQWNSECIDDSLVLYIQDGNGTITFDGSIMPPGILYPVNPGCRENENIEVVFQSELLANSYILYGIIPSDEGADTYINTMYFEGISETIYLPALPADTSANIFVLGIDNGTRICAKFNYLIK